MSAALGHFAFGANWRSFASGVSAERVAGAIDGLGRLIPADTIRGRKVLDIGCGSGLSMLAALRLGASEVVGIDLDEDSVAASRGLLREHAPDGAWRVEQASVFTLPRTMADRFPIVHSWGVLHHTGDMRNAIAAAAEMAAPGGMLAIAIYLRTPLCRAWEVEKLIYSRLPNAMQAPIRVAYKAAYAAGLMATGRSPWQYARSLRDRGMSWSHDVHDWLGGFPYESATKDEICRQLGELGFSARCLTMREAGLGVFGSTCAEYVATRMPVPGTDRS